MNKIVTRFAPSPTGHLHIGGARTALFSWLLARHFNGTFYLRIEDTDIERSKKAYEETIINAMKWLGLYWDGAIIYQTQRFDRYKEIVQKLLDTNQAYWCHCSQEEVEAMREVARKRGDKPKYNGHCRDKNLSASPGGVVRLKAPNVGEIVFDDFVKGKIVIQASELDDMVIQRSGGAPTYQLAVVVDDHDMSVTHVIRGDDHVSNTPKQIILYNALGWNIPTFGHIPMILGQDRQKLSKRHGARAVIEYQEEGILPQAIVNYLVRLGWSHGDEEIFSIQELIRLFDGTKLNSASSAFDLEKLRWFNSYYIKKMSVSELAESIVPFLENKGFLDISKGQLERVIPLYRDRVATLVELAEALIPIFIGYENLVYDESDIKKVFKLEKKAHIIALYESFACIDDFNQDIIVRTIHDYAKEHSLSLKDIGPILRVMTVGSLSGPDLAAFFAALGKEETLQRIDRSLKFFT